MIPEPELIELVFDHLCEHHAEAVAGMDDDEIFRRSGVAVRRAARYGFTKESSVAAYAALMFLVAPNFDEQPAITAVLASPRLSADARIGKIHTLTTEADWDAAGAAADPSAWD
jgi:hypothetical protein